MNTRPRDSQRSKVYAAENATFTYGQTIPNDGLQKRVNEILDRRPIRARWGARSVSAILGRGGGWAGGGRISLGVSSRNDWMICHELAHILTPRQYAAHGPEYVGVYLFLVETVLGVEQARALREQFRAKRVKSNRKAIPAVLAEVPASRDQRDRERRKAATEEAARTITRLISTGRITKAAARRVVDAA